MQFDAVCIAFSSPLRWSSYCSSASRVQQAVLGLQIPVEDPLASSKNNTCQCLGVEIFKAQQDLADVEPAKPSKDM